MRAAAVILCLSLCAAMFVVGCDSLGVTTPDSSGFVHPKVSVHYVNGTDAEIHKAQGLINVELIVTTVSGQDYSPAPVIVDDTIEDEVVFDLVLPADSVYSFRVRFVENGQLVGEGGVLQLITEESVEVDIPVVSTGDEPMFALVPSLVMTKPISGSIDLVMRYYGDSNGIAGLAVRFSLTGPTPVAIEFEGADIEESSGNQVSLAWQFGQPISGINDVGTIKVPLSGVAEFCLELGLEDTRIVNRDGEITIIGGSGACIDVKQ